MECSFASGKIYFPSTSAPLDTFYWKKEFQAGTNFNQATFSNNWKAGGNNSMALGLLFHGTATYEKAKHKWRNELQTDYGFQKLKGSSSRKTLDRIFFDTKYAYDLNKKLSLFGSANLVTQFAQGFSYSPDSAGVEKPSYVSHFFSPAYLIEAMGVQYHPLSYLTFDFGVGGLRHTFVTDTTLYKQVPNNYGVPIGSKMRTQAVFQFTANFDKEVLKNIVIKTRYAAVLDYEKLRAKNIVHRVDFSLNAKVNKWISASLTSILLYDIDQDSQIQYNQMLGIGILYNTNK